VLQAVYICKEKKKKKKKVAAQANLRTSQNKMGFFPGL